MGMNILELCLSPDYGGLELHMRDFSRWLSMQKGIKLFLCLQRNSRIHKDLENHASQVLLFSSNTGKFPFNKALQLKQFINQHDIGVVHVHWKFDLPLVALTKKFSKKKFRFVHTRQMNMNR